MHRIKEICETCIRYGYRCAHPAATGRVAGLSKANLACLSRDRLENPEQDTQAPGKSEAERAPLAGGAD